ncbi:ComEA family DNA-binding protein [Micromonospora sp. NIE79]|uniref:ComEA family DNA-binding protein n=1 Tax=Micromonospora trifolii TaxID=2911208 RepID=A0ABS9MZX3_9ACTN|nr:ComEA family DNA-binding protein [Micromonospora trifolii]MCG5443255.1 ComEA family DNA-binding protein [Micromonospora trifolii]
MSHDEETEVRQRLRRLTEAAVAPPPRPEAPFTGVPPSSLVGAQPATELVAKLASDGLAVPSESRLPGPGAFDPGRRGVRALAVVAVVVVVGAAGWAWQARPQSEPVAPLASDAASAPPAGDPSMSSSGEVVVAVAGKVRKPGLVRLPAGSRLADAVQAAGGALPGVDVALLNPARKVTDGELIVVGVTPPPVPGGAAGPAAGGAAPAAGPLNLNTATLAQLDALPGVGPVLAQRILTHRDQHGGFKSVGDLRQVDGIGDARYEQLKDLVTV